MKYAIMASLVAMLTAVGTTDALAEFPERPITLIVPFAPGGSTDYLGRLMARHAEKQLDVPIVVENRPGAGSIIGVTAVAQAKPDGYTIGALSFPTFAGPIYEKRASYTLDSFIPLVNQTAGRVALVVPAGSEIDTLDEFVEHAKAQSDPMIVAVPTRPGPPYYLALAIEKIAGFKASYPPFNGGAPVRTAILGNHVPSAMLSTAEVLESVRAGQMKAIAVTGAERWDAMPDTPTFAEEGFAFDSEAIFGSMVGYFIPAGTPDDVVDTLVTAFEAAAQDPAYLAEAKEQNIPVHFVPHENYVGMIAGAYGALEAAMSDSAQ